MQSLTDKLEHVKSLFTLEECWLWQWSCNTGGYGHVRVKGKNLTVHRAAWEYWVGPIPEGACVLHWCDTPPCINPEHLHLGTQTLNMLERDDRQRNPHAFGAVNIYRV